MDGGVEQVADPTARFERRLPAVPASVPRLRQELTEWIRRVGLDEERVHAVRLAVSEALTNAVVHAFLHSEPGTILLAAEPGTDVLEVRVTDDGSGMGPRPDSPGLGMGVPMIGKLCASVDLGQGADGTGTEVRMVFAVPGLTAPEGADGDHVEDILSALAQMGAGEGFGGSDIGALADLLVPRLADLCSVTLLEVDGTARRVGARVAGPDGTPDPVATAWVMDFPISGPSAPSYQAAVSGRVAIVRVDEAFAHRVSPDPERAAVLLGLQLSWWAAVPLRSGGRAVGSVAVAGRRGEPERVVATLERIAAQAGGLVATARLVDDLKRTQRRLSQILGALIEAVTVSDAEGRVVYANAAATDLLGAADANELLRADPGELADRFDITDEHGTPIPEDDLPHRRLFQGLPALPTVTRSVHRVSGRTLWLRTTATMLDDGQLAVSVIQDITAERGAELRQRLLAEAGETLAGALGQPDTYEKVARLAVPALADGCIVDLVGADDALELALVEHVDPEQGDAIRRSRERHPPDVESPHGAGSVLRDERPDVINDVTDELLQVVAQDGGHLAELRALDLRSAATFPMTVHGRALGVMTLVNDVSGRRFADADVALALDLAGRAAVAVDNARLYAEQARTQRELETSLGRLRLLADAGFGGLIRGVGDRIVEANAMFLRMVGYDDAHELPPWPQMTPPEWAHADARALAQMRETGTADIFEKEFLRHDGSRVRVLVGATVADTAAFEWIGVVVDVSERLADDERRRTGLDRIRMVTQEPPVPLTGRDTDGVADVVAGLAAAVLIQRPGQGIVYANQAAAEAMGMASPQEVMAATPEEIAEGWDTFDEEGIPLEPARYPSRRILLGERSVEPLTVRAVNRRTGREYWRMIRARPVFDADGRLAMAVSMTEDITEMRRAMLTQRLLAVAGEVLSSSMDYRRTLGRLATLTVPELADWCSIAMPDDHGMIRQVAVAHANRDKVQFAREYDERYAPSVTAEGGSAEILRGGPSVLTPDIPDELLQEAITDPEQLEQLRSIGMRSAIQVPIAPAGGTPIGVLTLINAESGRVFTAADLALVEELGRRAGTAVQNARLHSERAHIAATLQASLLPDELPDLPGFALSCTYRPAGKENWVGGDFYDVFEVQGGWMVIVGDVAGHGAEAAALTAQARHTLRAIGEAFGDPVRAVAHLNRLLVPRDEPALCTVCAVLLRVAPDGTATATITCAGHPLPCLVRDGEVRQVGRWGPLLGAWESTFEATDIPLQEDDVLVLYTDGVLDSRAGTGRFGEERLEAVLRQARGAHDAVARVQHALDTFQTGEQADDTAVLAIQRRLR
jgi:serine phosphatase RsbU (regulator of sigma subunit)/PAS domain-containing protein/anti-sigma regulatory factor (Ser/Thr protein kinase)